MYIPSTFHETDAERLYDFMEANSFATLVSSQAGSLAATHLPLLLDREAGSPRLFGHVARANPQWRELSGDVLVLFTGPHVYVSPTWYEADDVVPTWNYVAVHVYGSAQLIEAEDRVLELLRRTVDTYERTKPQPWQLTGSPEYLQKMVRGIVAFQIDITRIEGKWKLSQNHPEERRHKVVQALQRQTDENSQAVAALMAAGLAQGVPRNP
jgi:transcriptional regulator